MDTDKLTAEEIFDLFKSKAGEPLGIVFYIQKKMDDTGVQLASMVIDFNTKWRGVEKLRSVMNESRFVSWFGLDDGENATHSNSSVIEDWHKKWKY